MFLNAFGFSLQLCRTARYVQTVHLYAQTDEFLWRYGDGFALNLPRTQRFEAEYRGCPTSNLYVYIVHVRLVAFLITVINDKPRLIHVKRVFIL